MCVPDIEWVRGSQVGGICKPEEWKASEYRVVTDISNATTDALFFLSFLFLI